MAAHSSPRTPPRRTRRDRGKAREIAAGDSALGLRKGIRECLTVGKQILLQGGMDDICRTATLDFGDQPKRSMIALVDAKCLGGGSSHLPSHCNIVTSV